GKSVSHLFQGPSPPNRLLRLWSQFRMTRAISYINDPLSVLRMVFHRRHPVLVPLRLLSIHKIPLLSRGPPYPSHPAIPHSHTSSVPFDRKGNQDHPARAVHICYRLAL